VYRPLSLGNTQLRNICCPAVAQGKNAMPKKPENDRRGNTGATGGKKALNDRTLKTIKPAKPGRRDMYMDSLVPGFGVRVTDKGNKTFVLVARYPGSSNPTRRSLGDVGALSLADARTKARKWIEMLGRGIDPATEAERELLAQQRKRANTFAAMAEDFIATKLPTERKGREVELDIRREFIPAWGGRPLEEITPLDVRAVILAAKGRPYQAHNLLGEIKRMFGWAIDQHVYGIDRSPCDRLKATALLGEKVFRTRILSDSEIRAFWQATEKLGYPYGPLFRLLLLTGQRRSEVGEAKWTEFDLAKKAWSIPPARMKFANAHVVPLSDDAIAILQSLPRFEGGDYLFSSDGGKTTVKGYGRAKIALDKTLGRIEPWVLHDLRRTMRTGLSQFPTITDLVRELVIGHTKPGLHRVYDQHAYLKEKRDALDAWAAHVRSIIAPPPSDKVVTLAKARVS
jgi:integrase